MSDVMDALTVLGILVPVLLLFRRDIKTWDNKGVGIIELVIITAISALLFLLLFPRPARAQGRQEMYLTCYCPESCPGTITYTGAHVREGIAAVTQEHIGDGVMIWTRDGKYLGYFECLDKIGTGKSTVIDIWQPDLESAKQIMEQTQGRVIVSWIKKPKG